jgi:Uncharacterized stress-induced protein
VLNDSGANRAAPLAEAQAAFAVVLEGLDDSRAREGERLAAHLRERTEGMRALVARVRERAPQVRDAWLERLRQRCADLGVDVEPQRLAQEMALAAQKLDVDEEMSRLAGHLDEIEAVLRRDEAVGRRLDFLMQELNRETNTLGSKAQDEELHPLRGRHEGADRADARAGPEHRVTRPADGVAAARGRLQANDGSPGARLAAPSKSSCYRLKT